MPLSKVRRVDSTNHQPTIRWGIDDTDDKVQFDILIGLSLMQLSSHKHVTLRNELRLGVKFSKRWLLR